MIKKNKIDEILPLIYSIEIRDTYTQGHSERVAHYARELASFLKLSKKEINDIYIAGLLHDLGKIGIPDTILLKPEKLDKDEFELIKQHSVLSGEIVKKLPNFSYLYKIVRHHHENFDGSGYPDGLRGEEIPLLSRIISVVDVFDALATARIYRTGLSLNKSIEIMKIMQKNSKFDPEIFEAFLEFIKKHGIYRHEKKIPLKLKELDQKRKDFFYKDPLTKLLNRTAFLGLLRKTHDYGYRATLILCNIKRFRLYNQKYGLRKGDDVLKKIANILANNLDPIVNIKEPQIKDLFLFRVMNDKFVIFYMGSRSEFFKYKLEKIEKKIKTEIDLEIEYIFLIKGEKIKKNFEDEIGYLL